MSKSGGAMREAIEAGSILIERGTLMPDSWLPQGRPGSNGWISVGKLDKAGFEASIQQAGWTFFYLAGEVRATVFGFDEQTTVIKALKRLTTNVKSQRLNCLEITRVAKSTFLGVPCATVAGHARHIQEGLVLSQGRVPRNGATRRNRPSDAMEEASPAEAVAAWEDEGGAPGQIVGRLAA